MLARLLVTPLGHAICVPRHILWHAREEKRSEGRVNGVSVSIEFLRLRFALALLDTYAWYDLIPACDH